jgi:RHS repeat-associated protein
MIAMWDGTGLKYMLSDHLGSMVAITDDSGTLKSQQRYLPFGAERTEVGAIGQTDYGFTGQRDNTYIKLYDYRFRWYDPQLTRFISPDSIVPNLYNPQALNRYAYVLNNPVRYNDPSGHKVCEDVDANGKCTGDKIARLLDYVHKNILNDKGEIKKKHKSLDAMEMVVKKAASIYGRDWNGFLDATTFVFTGYYGHGSGAMLGAHLSDFDGYFDGDSGFHGDFRDQSNQVRHFWAAFATAANPYGNNPFGEASAHIGNVEHDILEDWVWNSGGTKMDYELSLTGIDIASQVGKEKEITTPAELAAVLVYRLGENGPGYLGDPVSPKWWRSPYE